MKQISIIFLILSTFSLVAQAQQTVTWSEADRKYLLENLQRSRDELIKETKGLSKAQWSFKESPDRWSINQVVEHIAIWELLMTHSIGIQLRDKPHPELSKDRTGDSLNLKFIMEEKQHHSLEYTKPFSYTIPMGLNELNSNVAWLLKMRNESIELVKTTSQDLRAHYLTGDDSNTHQTYITLFGHTDRHLRQIRKVKQHPKYPK